MSYNRKWQYARPKRPYCDFLSLEHTFSEFVVVENLRFAVGISVLTVIILEILRLPVRRPHCYLRLSVGVAFIWGHFL